MPPPTPAASAPLHSPLVRWWFDGWCRRALRRQFYRLQRFGDPDWLKRFNPQIPRLYIANHASFWDGVVLHHLLRRHLRQPAYCLIDRRQVARHPFFARVGGIAIDRRRPRDAIAAIAGAAGVLAAPPHPRRGSNALVIFPEGELRPPDRRPICFEPAGLTRLLRECPPQAEVVVVALRYDFWVEQRGEAMMHLSPPIPASAFAGRPREDVVLTLESRLTAAADDLRDRSLRQELGEILLHGRRSISQWGRCGRRVDDEAAVPRQASGGSNRR